ncbi:MAG: hypothetical protein JSU80_12860 [Deltaproteobacteria bacterium]|nr:MAG: hypothetical protein JSU80_12860 [Deltaproteobacteria bacterium]
MATIALSTKTITKMVTRTIGFTDTIVTMRGPVVTITDITTNHTITVMVTTLTLGFTSLPTEAEFISGSAFDTALSVRIMVAPVFCFPGGR